MPTFRLRKGNTVRNLGQFVDINEVKRLRLFKDKPELIQYIEEIPISKCLELWPDINLTTIKQVYKSNRWRVIMKDNFYIDLVSHYSRTEVDSEYASIDTVVKVIKVPKYAYHANDSM